MVLLNLVVSINQNNLIGIDNDLLIKSREDLKKFYKITTQHYPEGKKNIVIMGYNTWISLPESKRPLKNRMNIVLTQNRRDLIEETENLKVLDSLFNAIDWCNTNESGRVFIIGGESIYEQCYLQHQNKINMIYLTKFIEDTKSSVGKTFPREIIDKMTLLKETSKNEDCEVLIEGKYIKKELKTIYKTFQNNFMINIEENNYMNLLKRIINEGNLTQTRNSFTLNTFGERMIFDMNNGFPLLTTKKMGYKTILRELLWFIRGSTSNQELLDKNVHIWSQNSSRDFLNSRGLDYEEGDLGPVYGFQWRHSGAEYVDCHTDYTGLGVDQLKNVIHLIKTEPHSRRIIMNAWNPSDLNKMALPPCHVMCQFYVNSEDKTLDCQLYQRSGDMFLGVPFNIASYSFLLHIIANITGYNPGRLIHILGDTHIYNEHIDAVNEQLERLPGKFPELIVKEKITDIDSIDESIFELQNYKSYDKITAPMIA
jgi:dihydrofolate reductase/thymidylate synthase